MHDEPALMAEVHTTPLIIEGTTEIPPRTKAMTKGDWAAVPVEMERSGSSNRLYCLRKSVWNLRQAPPEGERATR